MQGIKDSGQKFYILMIFFSKIETHPTSVDGGFYAFFYKENHLVYLFSETDECSISADSNCSATTPLFNTMLSADCGFRSSF